MSANSETFPPPNEPADFESLCLDLWKDIWNDPGAQKNGRSGQSQAGVDVHGRQNGKWVGVQCKQKNNLLWTKVTLKELEEEVAKARDFKPPLSAFILATTGDADAKLQQRARELTDEHSAKGLFAVEVWSWGKIWQEIYGRENLLRRIGPVYWPRYSKLIEERLGPKHVRNAGRMHGGLDLPPRIFLSYARKDGEAFATALRKRLESEHPDLTVWQDRAKLEGGVGWWNQIEEALDTVQFLVLVMTPGALVSETTRKEWRYARQKGVVVYPVKGTTDAQLDFASVPNWMNKAHWLAVGALDAEGTLATGPEWETFIGHLRSHHERRCVPFMAPDLPEGFVPRPAEFNQLLGHLLDADRQNPVAITTALAGAGGFGKTTLAIALCHNDDVINAFYDGILWATLGEQPEVREQLTKLYTALTGERPKFLDEEEAARELSNKLDSRNCLLVVDDAWNTAHVRPFLRGAKGCARLITSRQFDVIAEAHVETRRVDVDEMSGPEAVAVLTQGLEPVPADLSNFPLLARRLGEWPLLLGLANSALRQRVLRGDTVAGALSFLVKALDQQGLTAFDHRNATERKDAVRKSVGVSLDLLTRDERDRYAELAIFPEDTDIPRRTVGTLWAKGDVETDRLLTTLADFSLLKFDLQTGAVRLHDVLRSYMAEQLSDKAALHRRLVGGWADLYALPDFYAWRWLAYHLVQGQNEPQLRGLLFDFNWLQAKLNATGVSALLADFNHLPEDEELALVQSALRISAHVLRVDKNQLAGQLVGRLEGQKGEGILNVIGGARHWRSVAWLQPLHLSLHPPGTSLLRTLQGHREKVTGVALSADGRWAVSSSEDKTLKVWEMERGRELNTLRGHAGEVSAVAMTADGCRILSGSEDKTLKLWNVKTGHELRTLAGHVGGVSAVAMTADGRRALSGSKDCTLKVWDLESGREVRTLQGHADAVSAVALSSDGRRAVSGAWDGTLMVWDVESGRATIKVQGSWGSVRAVALSADGRRAIVGFWNQPLIVYDVEHGRSVCTLQSHGSPVRAVALSADGRRAVSGADDWNLKVWDLESGSEVRSLRGHAGGVTTVVLSADGRRAVSGSSDHTLKVWDLEKGGQMSPPPGHAGKVTAVALSADGERAISASEDQTLKVWEVESGRSPRTLQAGGSPVGAVALTADGHRAVSGAEDGTLKVWNTEAGRAVRILQDDGFPVNGVGLSADGRRAVSGSGDRTLRVWDVSSGREVHTLEGHSDSIRVVALSADGRRAVSGSRDRTLNLWDVEKGQKVLTLQSRGAVNAAALSANGRLAVLRLRNKTLMVWDLENGLKVHTLRGHASEVNSLAMSTDGQWVVSGSDDQTLKVWELKGGKCLATFFSESAITCCALSCEGRTIVAGEQSGRIHFLRLVLPNDPTEEESCGRKTLTQEVSAPPHQFSEKSLVDPSPLYNEPKPYHHSRPRH